MKKLLKISASFLIVTSFFSCSKNSCDLNDIEKKASNVTAATEKFIDDDSKENCEAYKKSLQDYLNAIDGCEGYSIADIEKAKKELAEIDCN